MGNKFVIQEHHARSKHFDFRLEVDGMLKSWAVPKGLSTDPRVKHLAIETPDHALSYANFEGVIPEGEGGAGPVIIWDRGTYQNLDDETIAHQLRRGHVKVSLNGVKLKGGYALTRFADREGQWLIVKMKDEHADARRNPARSEPKSVVSGKTIKQMERSR